MIKLKDSGVRFDAAEHRYFLEDKELYGITSTLIPTAFPDMYDGVPEAMLKQAAERGKNVHEAIQFCEENGLTSEMPEYASYRAFKEEHGLTYVTNEYIVTDRTRYASAIDLVFEDLDGNVVLADIKTTSKRHYDAVALQLSLYKRWFEKQNPKLKVSKCVMIWLRGDKSEYKELQPWADEVLDELIAADKDHVPFDINATYGDLPQKVYDVQQYMRQLEDEVKRKTDELKQLKEGLCNMMLERGIKTFTTSTIQMTTVQPKASEKFDSKAFAEDHPDLYKQYLKVGSVPKPSIKITYK